MITKTLVKKRLGIVAETAEKNNGDIQCYEQFDKYLMEILTERGDSSITSAEHAIAHDVM